MENCQLASHFREIFHFFDYNFPMYKVRHINLVSFERADQGLSNDTKLHMLDFIHWEVIVKIVKHIPKLGSESIYD